MDSSTEVKSDVARIGSATLPITAHGTPLPGICAVHSVVQRFHPNTLEAGVKAATGALPRDR